MDNPQMQNELILLSVLDGTYLSCSVYDIVLQLFVRVAL